MTKQNFIEKCYKDKNGKITLAQIPNPPLIVGLLAGLLRSVLGHGTVHGVLDLVGFGALFTWAWLELFQGSNYFRRLLGAVVLVLLIWNRI